METIKWLAQFIFGDNKSKRFKRFILLIAIIILSQCVSFGFDAKGKFYFSFTPFVKISKEL